MAISLFGYCRVLSVRYAWMPASRTTRLITMARTGRRMNKSVSFILGIGRLGVQLIPRLHVVIDIDRRIRPQAEDAGGHDFVTGIEAGSHRDPVAASDAQLHKLLLHVRL